MAYLGRSNEARDQSLWMSLAASLLAHAIALAVFAGLLIPRPGTVSAKLGVPTVVQVLLVEARPAEKASEPATLAEISPPRPEPLPATTTLPLPKPQEPPPEPPVPVRRIDLRVAAAPHIGTATPTEVASDEPADHTPIPPGDTAVGVARTLAAIGKAQALRLAQRFPEQVDRPPRIHGPLVVPYPPSAALAHREGRVSAIVIVDSDGRALEATLVPDDPLFGPTVEDALRRASFKPAETNARPVTYWLVLEFVFTMRPATPSRSAR